MREVYGLERVGENGDKDISSGLQLGILDSGHLVRGDAAELTSYFPADRFDIVAAFACDEMAENPVTFVQMMRVLDVGGHSDADIFRKEGGKKIF